MLHPRHGALAPVPLLVPALLALLSGCSGSTTSAEPGQRLLPGGPLPGLSPAELASFERGRRVFARRFAPEDGLGPRYNATSCESCHSEPAAGGSAQLYRNFYVGLEGPPGRQIPLAGLDSAVVPSFGSGHDFTTSGARHALPEPDALVALAQRNALPLFGVGLFEMVSDATILALADPDDADGDGISGRFNTDGGALGRFGVKAQSNNLEVFTRAPLLNHLGVTSDPLLGSGAIVSLGAPQASTDPDAPTTDSDSESDPEISRRDLGDLIAFTRFLAPPRPIEPRSAAASRGAELFAALRCDACHVPELASARGPVRAYTDLLLHDMGPGLADGLGFGVPQAARSSPASTAAEFRTQPLWGVSLSAPFLHDGRAETLLDAILMHGGEARASRDAFAALVDAQRADVVAFLEHL